jgi:hypothetical protein
MLKPHGGCGVMHTDYDEIDSKKNINEYRDHVTAHLVLVRVPNRLSLASPAD